ncbi:hypothetical protein V8D89_006878 [Ganoderma adspersum]
MPPIHVHGTLLSSGRFLISSIFCPDTLSYDPHTLKSYLDFNDLLSTLKSESKDKIFEVSTQPILTGYRVTPHYSLFITKASQPPPPHELLILSLLQDISNKDPYKLSREERELFDHL